jgi:hypothetical protein
MKHQNLSVRFFSEFCGVPSVQELKGVASLNSWKSICDHLEIKTAGDSARRRLQKWVEKQSAVMAASAGYK